MLPTRESDQLKLMAIALIQDGIGKLSSEMAAELDQFEEDGMSWREFTIFKINGSKLPPQFIKLALIKKWQERGDEDVEAFTKDVLSDWGMT